MALKTTSKFIYSIGGDNARLWVEDSEYSSMAGIIYYLPFTTSTENG